MRKIIALIVCLLFTVGLVSALQVSVNNYDPQPAEAGKPVNVWFKVENDNDNIEEDVFIEITPKDGLSLTSGESVRQTIGIMPGRSSQIVQYRLLVNDDAFDGAHNIEVRVGAGSRGTSSSDLSIEVTDKDLKEVELAIGDIESDPSRIKPDDDNVKMEVIIQNLGDGIAQGVKAELISLPKGVTLSESYSGTSLLGNIAADSTSTATFFIDVDKEVVPKEHNAFVRVTYKYKPDEQENNLVFGEENIPLKLAIKPVPIYEITNVELIPEELTAGDKDVKLKLTIKNIGQEDGESVRIKAFGKSEQPIEFDIASDFVSPQMEPGEVGQATLEFDVDDEANLQIYWLDLEIKSVVNDDVITYNEKVKVEVINPKPSNPMGMIFIVLLVVVAIGLIIYFRNKRKKKPSPKRVSTKSESFLDKVK